MTLAVGFGRLIHLYILRYIIPRGIRKYISGPGRPGSQAVPRPDSVFPSSGMTVLVTCTACVQQSRVHQGSTGVVYSRVVPDPGTGRRWCTRADAGWITTRLDDACGYGKPGFLVILLPAGSLDSWLFYKRHLRGICHFARFCHFVTFRHFWDQFWRR